MGTFVYGPGELEMSYIHQWPNDVDSLAKVLSSSRCKANPASQI
jgi:hypothetical protein